MPGAYCRFCGRRCFVHRQVLVGGLIVWSGHMATCTYGRQHDRYKIGADFAAAHNTAEGGRHCTGPCCKTPANPTPGGTP